MSKRSSRESDRTGVVIWGLILIGVGGWFLLRTLGFPLPGIGAMWPIFPTVVGIAFFVGWLFTPDKGDAYGIMIPATINFLVGLFFFTFTLGIFDWSAMGYLWPVFPLIVGISFFVAWVFSLFRVWGLLIPGGITAMVGIVGLAFTLGAEAGYLQWVFKLWPLALIALGLGTRAITAAATHQRRRDALLMPLSALLMTFIVARAVWWHFGPGPTWKGRTLDL